MYRLKKEAIPFFNEKVATKILSLGEWENLKIDTNALEKIEAVRVEYGHEKKCGTDLCGWRKDDGSHFYFTIYYPSIKYQEHDKFTNGRMIRELMDKIQQVINSHYSDLLTKE